MIHCICLACNFDLTCTNIDLSAILKDIAIHKAPGDDSFDFGGFSNPVSVSEAIVSYKTEYQQLVENLCSAEGKHALFFSLASVDMYFVSQLAHVYSVLSRLDTWAW